jgi:uncharacterized protein
METVLEYAWLLPLGILAGALTTVAAMGGGIFLVAVLSAVLGPHAALASTAPALLVGNAERAWSFRKALDRDVAKSFLIGAVPGAALGGALSAELPSSVLACAIVGVTGFALARTAGLFELEIRPSMWAPFAFGAGAVAATSGAGIVVAPALVAGGLSGEALIATSAVAAVAMHVGRVLGYGAGGILGDAELGASVALAGSILVGNRLGRRLRDRLGPERSARVTQVTLVVSLVAGLAAVLR